LTNKEIGNKLEISRQLLSHHINKLNSNQLIEKSGVKKRSSWRLTEPGLEILNSTS
jgi:predicted transcriptional regulator